MTIKYSCAQRHFLQGNSLTNLSPQEMHEILALRDINLPNPHLIKQLKAILSIESESLQDYGDEFYTKLADLMTNEPQETWDKLYFIPSISKPIIIKEDVASISKGTTGCIFFFGIE